ncbi:MAG: hypothetical protein WC453_00255 [Patescibacteria group bacterium]
MLWINFLHLYQPANVEYYNIRKALDKSYWRLLRLMEEHPGLRMTWNVSGCLLERLELEKEKNFLAQLKFLVKKGRLELTGSAAYHGFLPLLPEDEVVRQIKANEKILRRFFGRAFKPRGFFLPEMAYSPAVAKIVKRLGYDWLILGEPAYNGGQPRVGRPDPDRYYLDAASGLKVVFRNREFSNAYPPDKLWPLFKQAAAGTYITATDAELYGLRHEDPTAELEKIVKLKSLQTMTVSQFIRRAGRRPAATIKVWPSSWESSAEEIRSGRPYQLWLDKQNKIQIALWQLANLALDLGRKYKNDKNYYWHRWHLSRGLASCTFWWASARDFSKVYGPYAWSPDDIVRGLEDLIRAVRSFADPKTKKPKLAAEKYYLRAQKLVWEKHWKKHWQKII